MPHLLKNYYNSLYRKSRNILMISNRKIIPFKQEKNYKSIIIHNKKIKIEKIKLTMKNIYFLKKLLHQSF